jgi:hypothetical protein
VAADSNPVVSGCRATRRPPYCNVWRGWYAAITLCNFGFAVGAILFEGWRRAIDYGRNEHSRAACSMTA